MIELLQKVQLFERLSEEQITVLLRSFSRKTYAPSEILFREKDTGSDFYVILKGSIKIYTTSRGGEEKILTVLKQGESFGELSLIDGKPRSASAQTLEHTILLSISRDVFMNLLKVNFDIMQSILIELSHRLRETNQHVSDLTFLDPRSRIIKNLITLANRHGTRDDQFIFVNVSLNVDELAQMAGVTSDLMTEVIRELEDRQFLRLSNDSFILNLSKLRG